MIRAARLQSRAVIRLSGADARPFLEGLITQEPPRPGEAAFAALLTPQGKILFDFIIVENDGVFLLDCHGDTADALAKRLSLYKLRANVTIERTGHAVGVVTGSLADAAAGVVYHDPRLADLGRRIIAPELVDDDAGDYDARRIALGVPEFGKDFTSDEVFLLDANFDALNGVNYKKGCFVGQEVTSRMKRKGEVRKRTLRASFDGASPAKGMPVTAGDATVGEILSGTDHNALALIRVDRLKAAHDAGLSVEAGGKALRIDVPAYLERG